VAPHGAKQQHNCRDLPEALRSGSINVRRTLAVRTTFAPYPKHGFSPQGIPERLGASSGTAGQQPMAHLGVARANALRSKPPEERMPRPPGSVHLRLQRSSHPLDRRLHRHPDPEGSQSTPVHYEPIKPTTLETSSGVCALPIPHA